MRTAPLAVVLVVLALSGCNVASAPSPVASTSVIAPVVLDAGQTRTTVAVGSIVVFDLPAPETWTLSADLPGHLVLRTGGVEDGVISRPSAIAITPGETTVTLANLATGEAHRFRISVESRR